jgi:hypothetical protein
MAVAALLLLSVGCTDWMGDPGRPSVGRRVGDWPSPLKLANGSSRSSIAPDIYVVTADDTTFYDIAKKVYGDGQLWRRVAEANPDVNQAHLRPGQQLIVPSLPDAKDDDELLSAEMDTMMGR